MTLVFCPSDGRLLDTPYIPKSEESRYEKETPLDNDDLGVPFDFAWECLGFKDYFDFVETGEN